jgi:hypothetical protein
MFVEGRLQQIPVNALKAIESEFVGAVAGVAQTRFLHLNLRFSSGLRTTLHHTMVTGGRYG